MTQEQSIFDVNGRVRADVEVPADRQLARDELLAAEAMTQQCEAEFKTSELELAAAVRRRDQIAAALPKVDRIDLVRQAAAQFRDEHR